VLGEPRLEFLLDAVPEVPAAESGNLALAFRTWKDEVGPLLLQRAQKVADLNHQARYAILLLDLGSLDAVRPMLAAIRNPAPRSTVIDLMQSWHGNLAALPDLLRHCDDEACRSGLCAAVGRVDPATLSSEVDQALTEVLEQLYHTAPDGGSHSAADWALRQWHRPLPAIEPSLGPPGGRRWFVNRVGMTMTELPPGTCTIDSVELVQTRPYFLSNREVSVGQFQRSLRDPDYPRDRKPDWPGPDSFISPKEDYPVNNVDHNDIVLFCNWLSQREGRKPCYQRADKGLWTCDYGADGYRLPTQVEWEYAHQAGATTRYFFGEDTRWLTSYAHVAAMRAAPGGSKLPNRWGLFDLAGNVWEMCEDYLPDPLPAVIAPDFKGWPGGGEGWVFRGGSYETGRYNTGRGLSVLINRRDHSAGFRVLCAAAAGAGR
jgi:formylglycine-generating enzyme required for sulfatase activity